MNAAKLRLILFGLAPLLGILLTAASCNDSDVFDDSEPTEISGSVNTITGDGNDTIGSAEGARVEFFRDPGENSLEDRVTFVDVNSNYRLKVGMDDDVCSPIRYSLSQYYDQDHTVCEEDGDQTLNVTLISAEEPAGGRNCQFVCERELNCDDHFQNVYESIDECLNHCNNGCDMDGYMGCAFQFSDQEFNLNRTCEAIYSCFGNFCDDTWRDIGDDDDDDDDTADDDDDDDTDDDDDDDDDDEAN